MRRFFIDQKAVKENSVVISGAEAHHIRDVIRLKTGERFLGFDDTGKTYTLRVKRLTGLLVEAEVEKVSSKGLDIPRILLGCALPKKSRIDYIIEKATELGVSEIIPVITERTVVKISDRSKIAKQKRWEKIALQASKQCGRDRLPKLYEVMKFKEAIQLTEDLSYEKKILPCLYEGSRHLGEML